MSLGIIETNQQTNNVDVRNMDTLFTYYIAFNPSYYIPTVNGKTFSNCVHFMVGEVVLHPNPLDSKLLLQQW